MRKRAGLARALVLDPQIILCDEPDSGLDPVRTAYLSQLLIDLNAEIDATILIVTHDIQIARTVPDNIGMLFRGNLVMFGPREVLLTSENPVITQFVNGRRIGPIGMSEEKDEATLAPGAGQRSATATATRARPALMPQLVPSPGAARAAGRAAAHGPGACPCCPPCPPRRSRRSWPSLRRPASGTVPAPATAQDPERDQAQAQARAEAWKLAREREAAQREAARSRDPPEQRRRPGSWPPDWPGGGG